MATISFIDKTTHHPLTINFHKDGDSLFSDRVRFLIVFASRTCVDRSRSNDHFIQGNIYVFHHTLLLVHRRNSSVSRKSKEAVGFVVVVM